MSVETNHLNRNIDFFPAKRAIIPSAMVALLAACSTDTQPSEDASQPSPPANVENQTTLVEGIQEPLGDGFVSGSSFQGSDGFDVVSLNLNTATIRDGDLLDIETVNIVFNAPATFDGRNALDLTTINLGLDGFDDPTDEVASTADVDLNEMGQAFTTLNIHASQQLIEVDYQSGINASLSVNFDNDSGDITVGGGEYIGISHLTLIFDAIEIIHVDHVAFNHVSTNEARVVSFVDLFDDTTSLEFTTLFEEGDLVMVDPDAAIGGSRAALVRTSQVEDVLIAAEHGDMALGADDDFIQDATSLQTYVVTTDDAEVTLGTVGERGFAAELELLTFATFDTGVIEQGAIIAFGADVAFFNVTSSDSNKVSGTHASSGVNVYIDSFVATAVSSQSLNALDGGNIELNNQNYVVEHQVFTGSGDVTISGGPVGYRQMQAADAAEHSGARTFIGGTGDDVFYGSDAADTILMTSLSGSDLYLDAGGADTVTHEANAGTAAALFFDDGSTDLSDSGSASDDRYTIEGTTGSGNSASMQFFAGGGNDVLQLNAGGVLVDFADYDSDVLFIGQFTVNTAVPIAGDALSFDGMSGISMAGAIAQPAAIGSAFDSNSVYVFADGDTALAGGVATIASFFNFSDVADYLDEAFAATSGGDTAIFVINNLSKSAAFGNRLDFYVYHFSENGESTGIQADELELIALSITSNGSITVNDIV